ncbi:MAG TPA: lipid II flippase MurJ, partial [Xanthomonadales bacterium]|nr:lipid II flippase MurJ [Xanthomonadales bacterium]
VSNMFLNFLFVGTLLAVHFHGAHTGLALASSVAAYINASMLYRGLRRQGAYLPEPGWNRVFVAVLVACALMVAGLLWRYGSLPEWFAAPAGTRIRMLAELIVGACLVYAVALFGAGLRKHHLEKGAV